MLTFSTTAFPAISLAVRETSGAAARHGPHHSAQKSTNTGTREFWTISSNNTSSTSMGSATGGKGDLQDPQRPVSARCLAGDTISQSAVAAGTDDRHRTPLSNPNHNNSAPFSVSIDRPIFVCYRRLHQLWRGPAFLNPFGESTLPFIERRRANRFELQLHVIIRWREGNEICEAQAVSEDVSSNGIYFIMREGIQEETCVEPEMTLPHQITRAGLVRARCFGRIQRCELKEGKIVGMAAAIEKYGFLRGKTHVRSDVGQHLSLPEAQ